MGPDGIVFGYGVELVEAKQARADIETLVRLADHCGRAVGCVEAEAALDNASRVLSAATAELENVGTFIKPVEKSVKVAARRLTEAERVTRRVLFVERYRRRVAHSDAGSR